MSRTNARPVMRRWSGGVAVVLFAALGGVLAWNGWEGAHSGASETPREQRRVPRPVRGDEPLNLDDVDAIFVDASEPAAGVQVAFLPGEWRTLRRLAGVGGASFPMLAALGRDPERFEADTTASTALERELDALLGSADPAGFESRVLRRLRFVVHEAVEDGPLRATVLESTEAWVRRSREQGRIVVDGPDGRLWVFEPKRAEGEKGPERPEPETRAIPEAYALGAPTYDLLLSERADPPGPGDETGVSLYATAWYALFVDVLETRPKGESVRGAGARCRAAIPDLPLLARLCEADGDVRYGPRDLDALDDEIRRVEPRAAGSAAAVHGLHVLAFASREARIDGRGLDLVLSDE